MCGRFVGFRPLEDLIDAYPIDVSQVEAYENYNIAPSQKVLAIVRFEEKNHLVKLHWGLVPFWAKDKRIASRLINARAETAASKPSFRTAFRKRRCLILADGFFEWQGAAGSKQPMFLTLPDERPLAFAGLWETWDDRGQASVPHRSCTILTREASPSVRPIHHRMPVILQPEAYMDWLDPANTDIQTLEHILTDQIITELKSRPVSKQINSTRNQGPDNLRQLELF